MSDIQLLEIVKDSLGVISDLQTIYSIFKPLGNFVDMKLNSEPEFIKESVENSLIEAAKQIRNNVEFQGGYLRSDWYSENVPNDFAKIFYRTITSMLIDIQCKKSRYIGSFWKNIQMMENSRIDIGSAFEYFDIIDQISYRGLCIIKFRVEYGTGSERWEYDPIDEGVSTKEIYQMNQDDKHKFHNISREMLKLTEIHVISGTGAPMIDDYKYCASHMLLSQPTYLGNDLYNLMELSEIPDTEVMNELSVWNTRVKS